MPRPTSPAIAANPFYQPARQWQIRLEVPRDHVAAVEEALTDLALAIASFELDEATALWRIDVLTDTRPEEAGIAARLALAFGMMEAETPAHTVTEVETKDWVSEVQRGFPPLHIGRFYVYGSHVESPPPQGKIALQVNAGAAFGSGEHATTSSCLRALGDLARKHRFRKPLDMGCGSGILALAMAKLWHVPVLGIDIDPVSVAVARENAAHNRITGLAQFSAADGYNAAVVRQGAPFDLIAANILARPLMRFAPKLARYLAPGGVAVLSGLLVSQERMVLAAHRRHGIALAGRVRIGGWGTLILHKLS